MLSRKLQRGCRTQHHSVPPGRVPRLQQVAKVCPAVQVAIAAAQVSQQHHPRIRQHTLGGVNVKQHSLELVITNTAVNEVPAFLPVRGNNLDACLFFSIYRAHTICKYMYVFLIATGTVTVAVLCYSATLSCSG